MPKYYCYILVFISTVVKAQLYEEKFTIAELTQRKNKIIQQPNSEKKERDYLKAVADLASRYNSVNKADSCLIVSQESLALAEKQENYYFIAYSKLNIAYAYQLKELYFEASTYFEETILAAQKARNDSLLALTYYLGGMCYNEQKLYRRSLVLLYKGVSVAKVRPYNNLLTRCLNTMGLAYSDINKLDSALICFKECLKIAEQSHIERMIPISYKNIGKVLLSMNKTNEGIANINKSIELFDKNKNAQIKNLVVYSYLELAKHYDSTKDYESAWKYATMGDSLNKYLKYTDLELEFNKIIYRYYKFKGKPVEALQHLEKYQQSSEKVNTTYLSQQQTVLEERFKSQQQQNQIILLNQEKQVQKNEYKWLISTMIGVLIFAMVLLYFNQTIQLQKREIEYANEQLEKKVEERTAELQIAYNNIKGAMLRGQTIERKRVASELHDNLGGLLAAVKHTIEGIDYSDLSPQEQSVYRNLIVMVKDATRQIRELSHNLLPEELEKHGLVSAIQSLIMTLNLSKKTKFDLVISHSMPQYDKAIEFNLYSICLELCNNILKYSEANKAVIELIDKGSGIDLIISDDGIGFEIINDSRGMGLKNVKERARSLNGSVKIHSILNEGTIVKVSIPLIQSEVKLQL